MHELFSPKKWREWGTRPPVEKSGGRRPPAFPPHYSPDSDSLATLIYAVVNSRMDYCNTVLAGAPGTVTDKLQRVLNAAARVIILFCYAIMMRGHSGDIVARPPTPSVRRKWRMVCGCVWRRRDRIVLRVIDVVVVCVTSHCRHRRRRRLITTAILHLTHPPSVISPADHAHS